MFVFVVHSVTSEEESKGMYVFVVPKGPFLQLLSWLSDNFDHESVVGETKKTTEN